MWDLWMKGEAPLCVDEHWSMTAYSAYVVNSESHVTGIEVIHCTSDTEAMETARALLSGSTIAAIEVWHLTKCIGKVDRESSR
jgi:hypothetical protein